MKDSLPDLISEMSNLPAYLSAFSSLNEIASLKRRELSLRKQILEREKSNKRRIFWWVGILSLALGVSVTPFIDAGIHGLDYVRLILSSAFIGLGGCLLYLSR
jgi:hypothetical protein